MTRARPPAAPSMLLTGPVRTSGRCPAPPRMAAACRSRAAVARPVAQHPRCRARRRCRRSAAAAGEYPRTAAGFARRATARWRRPVNERGLGQEPTGEPDAGRPALGRDAHRHGDQRITGHGRPGGSEAVRRRQDRIQVVPLQRGVQRGLALQADGTCLSILPVVQVPGQLIGCFEDLLAEVPASPFRSAGG